MRFFVSLLILMFAFVTPRAAWGQLPLLRNALAGSGEVQEENETPEEFKKRLETWLSESREALKGLEAGGAAAALPEGISQIELDERRLSLEQTVMVIGRWLKDLDAVGKAHKAAEKARTEESSWSGFDEPPPYSVLMVDELLSEREAIKTKLASDEASQANFERLLAGVVSESKNNEDKLNQLVLAAQSAEEDKLEASKWRIELARIQARYFVSRAGFLETNLAVYRERVARSKAELALIDRKVNTARPHALFTDEDLEKIEKLAGERQAANKKELAAIAQRMKTALNERAKAQTALGKLLAVETDEKESDEVALARFRVEVAEERVNSLQTISEGLDSLLQLERLVIASYKDRAELLNSNDPEERERALVSLHTLERRLKAWLNVINSSLNTTGAELSKIEARASTISSTDPRFSLINERRSACSETFAMLQRSSSPVETQLKLVQRWINDYTTEEYDDSLGGKVVSFGKRLWSGAKKVWSFQLASFEDKIEVEGQVIRGRIPLTLGMLLRAMLFFAIAYWISFGVIRRIQNTVVSRGHMAEHHAQTLSKWVMIVVGVTLVVLSLSFLKIPLAAFAVFGGAVAIGVGFAMQTLIKNFISGIIILVERKIRVGDMLDVEGVIGRVVEVNARSSIIRSQNGVETILPNSVFLDNKVTNWTLSNRKMRRELRLGVAHCTEPRKVMDLMVEAAERHGLVCKDPGPFTTFDEFGENGLYFKLHFWMELEPNVSALVVTSDLRVMIEKKLSESDIERPYPIRQWRMVDGVEMKEPEEVQGKDRNELP